MSLLQSFERVPFEGVRNKFSSGATLVRAASRLYTEQSSATKVDQAKLPDKPTVIPHPTDNGEAVFVIDVGLMQAAEPVSRKLAKKLEHLGPSYVIKNSANDEENKRAHLKIAQQERGRRIVTISTSKGGKDRLRLMSDPEFMSEHGPIDMMSLDSVPLDRRHIRPAGRLILWFGMALPETHLTALAYKHWQENAAEEVGEGFVRDLSETGFYITKADIPILLSPSPSNDAIATALSEDNVHKILMVAAANDRMVNTDASHKWLQQKTGREIDYVIDPLRRDGDHAGITDNPDLQIREIERYLAGDREEAL